MPNDQKNDDSAQKQLELMQKMLKDASKILGDIHAEIKARKEKADDASKNIKEEGTP